MVISVQQPLGCRFRRIQNALACEAVSIQTVVRPERLRHVKLLVCRVSLYVCTHVQGDDDCNSLANTHDILSDNASPA